MSHSFCAWSAKPERRQSAGAFEVHRGGNLPPYWRRVRHLSSVLHWTVGITGLVGWAGCSEFRLDLNTTAGD